MSSTKYDDLVAREASALEAFRDQRVLVTGHTGFKGTWLGLWLEMLGAEVMGLSLPPEPDSLFERADLSGRWPQAIGDIRDPELVSSTLRDMNPDLVFHLAAQPLVRRSYSEPRFTFETNVMGTLNVLEAIMMAPRVRGCVVVTTDKVYRPSPVPHPHTEQEPLGGLDPYSTSKAACEHVVEGWRGLLHASSGVQVSSVRAGNVIGGGDAARDRLLPDLIRAFSCSEVARVRNPSHIRPWQHVLDPLHGYLLAASRMLSGLPKAPAMNFGPATEMSVQSVAESVASNWWAPVRWQVTEAPDVTENPQLSLDSSLAGRELGWSPTWNTDVAIKRTVQWWKAVGENEHPVEACLIDIKEFVREAGEDNSCEDS